MISSITPEQEKALDAYALEAIEQAYSTTPCDRAKGEAALRASYRAAGFPEPKVVLWARSPQEAVTQGPLLQFFLFGEGAGKVDDLPRDKELQIQARDFVTANWTSYLGGHLWASWASWRLAFFDVLGCDPIPEVEIIRDQTAHCGPTWVSGDLAVISERPTEIHRGYDSVGNRVLHNEDGPAALWGDGWDLYSIEGVSVPKHVVMDPESISLEHIDGEPNQEIQRIMRERYGMERWLVDVGASVVSMDSVSVESWNENAGSIERALMQVPTGEKFVVACDGSTERVYVMRAPDDAETPEDFYRAVTGSSSSNCLAQG